MNVTRSLSVSLVGFGESSEGHARFVLEIVSGSHRIDKYFSNFDEASIGCVGFAEEKLIDAENGVITRAFVAMYVDPTDKGLVVRLGDRAFPWSSGRFRATWDQRGRRREFRILDGGTTVASVRYQQAESVDSWPGGMATDFFFNIASTTRDAEHIERFIFSWTARSQGRDTLSQAFVDELERHLAAGRRAEHQ